MNLLLDTHIFLWFVNDEPKLSDPLKDLIEDENNFSYLSVASLWEMSIKYNLGKLTLAPSYQEFVEREVNQSRVILLNIKLEHLKINASLPFHHRDPFDRIIISQAMAENFPLITVDSVFHQYSIMLI
ncbi:type II toxin-antitoxin system VapC family toxin [Gloeothece verrucosa]|uniref:PilT protein domain protein n=1 Tax=Gloeothece verrucosa (strain PCC 7822) TaxID=497965 RepID=E0UM04_GLOV7|nr:type II toxin-antitoxin system VapC family toxin [Gloeothece verrucosa]ADN17984.1 PilT protein domain protein [Gloeothece verrucosa PCC 7822]